MWQNSFASRIAIRTFVQSRIIGCRKSAAGWCKMCLFRTDTTHRATLQPWTAMDGHGRPLTVRRGALPVRSRIYLAPSYSPILSYDLKPICPTDARYICESALRPHTHLTFIH